jgi:ABC-type Fe3+-siderophore transport system permease subunit
VTAGPPRGKKALALRSVVIYLLPVVLVVLSLSIGRYTTAGPAVVVRVLLSRVLPIHHSWSQAVDTIVMQVRLPRIVLGVFVGGGLAVGGASLQGLFRNPLGDEEARSLGVRTEAVKAAVVASVTLMTAAAVAVSGIIGWVGLVVPHAARMLVGPDHRRLLPASFALGASYLLIDDLSRTVSAQEVPIGILTALIGALFFAVLLRRTGAGWQ